MRGHSNVQGDRTMGINEHPTREFLSRLEKTFGFTPPQKSGMNTVDTIKAMDAGKVKVFVSMGGDFAAATPDKDYTEKALGNCGLNVQISTKLNRSHLIHGKKALILPCLGRTEKDIQYEKVQKVTVEDSMSMVHASQGQNSPASKSLLSEPKIVVEIALATFSNSKTPWKQMGEDYNLIREKISQTIPGFQNFNERILKPGGFYLGNSAARREWYTKSRKPNFMTAPLPNLKLAPNQFCLRTIRSHDQYNTTIYGLNDRYRGIDGERKVVFINSADREAMGFPPSAKVDIKSFAEDGVDRIVQEFILVDYNIPRSCLAAYFQETNVLVPIGSVADKSHTPTSKYIVTSLSLSK